MKKWKKPEIATVDENELKNVISAGACSYYCFMLFTFKTGDDK